jgi:hypothetical protein
MVLNKATNVAIHHEVGARILAQRVVLKAHLNLAH